MAETDITSIVLVTGPTRGLGRDVVLALARRRAGVLLAGRSPEKLEEVAAGARAAGAPWVATVVVDFASFASIRTASARISQIGDGVRSIDAVVANAGVQMSDRCHTTEDGIEVTFGVNVVANQLLLTLLDRVLSPDAHVVLVGSGTHFGSFGTRLLVATPKWEEPQRLASAGRPGDASARAGQRAYSTSKLAVNHLVHELNRRWPAPRRANVYDPGLMPGTGLARDLPPFKQWAWRRVMPMLRVLPGVTTPAASAEHLALLALGEEHPAVRNGYVVIGTVKAPSAESDDPHREGALWAYGEGVTGSAAPAR